MQSSKVVILLNLALGAGVLLGYHWSARDLSRAQVAATPPDMGNSIVKGIVRGTVPEQDLVVITHEPIAGLMGAMTMGFRAEPSRLLEGLGAGDLIEFTLSKREKELLVVAVRKEATR